MIAAVLAFRWLCHCKGHADPMKTTTLERIQPLLSALRGYSALSEVRPMVFHLTDRDFIHFHEEPEGVVADVRLTKGQVRMPVATSAEQAELLGRIEQTLAALDSRITHERRDGRASRKGSRD